MKRKIIQTAGKTMVVSLPSAWVKKYGIKKGEEVEVEERGAEISVSTKRGYDLEEIKIIYTVTSASVSIASSSSL